MGFSISWIAVKGAAKDDVLARMHLADTGRPDPENRAKMSFAELPSGWLLIYANKFDYASPKRIASASDGGIAIGCAIEEHVMFSGARAYQDGASLWSVTHDPNEGLTNLTMGGDLPPEAPAIRARILQKQEEEDNGAAQVDWVFNGPMEIAESVCGFKHDTRSETDGPSFTELEPVLGARRPSGGGFLQKIGAVFTRR